MSPESHDGHVTVLSRDLFRCFATSAVGTDNISPPGYKTAHESPQPINLTQSSHLALEGVSFRNRNADFQMTLYSQVQYSGSTSICVVFMRLPPLSLGLIS